MTALKKNLTDLAILGGSPAFEETLHVGRPNIGNRNRLLERINDILDRRWLTNNGMYVQQFERQVAQLVGVKHCVAMCNATVALEIAARALGLSGEVIVPAHTFVATAHALQWQEITPVFCDVDPLTHNVDPHKIEALITPRTTGIVGVHVWGRSCDIQAISEIANRHALKVLYDAAHAFACTHDGKMIGGFGEAEIFSFHATKFLNSTEGGAVVTNDDGLAEKIRLMRNFGFVGMDTVVHVGTNGKMNEFSAAMGLTSLESVEEIISINRRNYSLYREELASLPGIRFITYDERERNNYHYIVLEIDEPKTGIHRDLVMRILHAENVRARRYFYPGCHRMEPYRSYFPNAFLLLPETERLVQRTLVLPSGTAMGEAQVRGVCQIIKMAITCGAEISNEISKRQAKPSQVIQ